jgi:hypothetical protein
MFSLFSAPEKLAHPDSAALMITMLRTPANLNEFFMPHLD